MQAVDSVHPPGMIILLSGEIARFTSAVQCLTSLVAPLGTRASWQTGVLITKLLNMGLKSFMDQPDLQWVWIMGDDHVYRPDILMKLLDRGVDAIIPFVLNRHPPMDSTVAIWHNMENPTVPGRDFRMRFLEEFPGEGLYKLADNETCGDAGLLLRRRVVEAVEYPWYDTRRSGAWASDDQAFTRRIKEKGFNIYVDTDTTMGHLQPMAVVPMRTLDGKWSIRLVAGMKTVVDFIPVRGKYEVGQ